MVEHLKLIDHQHGFDKGHKHNNNTSHTGDNSIQNAMNLSSSFDTVNKTTIWLNNHIPVFPATG